MKSAMTSNFWTDKSLWVLLKRTLRYTTILDPISVQYTSYRLLVSICGKAVSGDFGLPRVVLKILISQYARPSLPLVSGGQRAFAECLCEHPISRTATGLRNSSPMRQEESRTGVTWKSW